LAGARSDLDDEMAVEALGISLDTDQAEGGCGLSGEDAERQRGSTLPG
jgi:hypothetical protein